jgi:hypothetical protein
MFGQPARNREDLLGKDGFSECVVGSELAQRGLFIESTPGPEKPQGAFVERRLLRARGWIETGAGGLFIEGICRSGLLCQRLLRLGAIETDLGRCLRMTLPSAWSWQ